MKYDKEKREIILKRKPNKLDKFVFDFIKILEEHTDYVIISGYISILLGRTRATEDIDVFIKKISEEKFFRLFDELKKDFWCLNTENKGEAFNYLKEHYSIRFARKGKAVPNFEVKFPKRKIDEENFQDAITVVMLGKKIKISSLERQVAFKKYYLESGKDIEDAIHLEELFKDSLDYEKINKLRYILEKIKKNEK
jgi:hypothetical protein